MQLAQQIVGVLSGVVFCVAFVPYIRAIVRRETQPSKASWLIWATLDSITLAGMAAANTLNGQIIGAVLGAWAVAILSFRYGKKGWTKLDVFCICGAMTGIGLWRWFNSPVTGIVVSNAVVLIASFPTFKTGWKEPEKEDRTAWTMYFASCVLALFAIPAFTAGDMAQPITFFLIESVMLFLVWRPRRPKYNYSPT